MNSRPFQILVGNHITTQLLCFINDNNILYMNSDYSSCDENYTKLEVIEKNIAKIFPNPVIDLMSIESANPSDYNKLSITNILGKVMFEKQLFLKEEWTVDVAALKHGIYFLTLESNKSNVLSQTIKFIKG